MREKPTPRIAGTKLRLWRQQRGLALRPAARLLDVDFADVSRYELGKVRPGLVTAVRIERVTEGFVPATLWVD